MSNPLSDWMEQATRQAMLHGIGDLTAPLEPGEYVAAAKVCPHQDCGWQLPTEWRRGTEMTRLRGTDETERLIQQHLEEHVADNWTATETGGKP